MKYVIGFDLAVVVVEVGAEVLRQQEVEDFRHMEEVLALQVQTVQAVGISVYLPLHKCALLTYTFQQMVLVQAEELDWTEVFEKVDLMELVAVIPRSSPFHTVWPIAASETQRLKT